MDEPSVVSGVETGCCLRGEIQGPHRIEGDYDDRGSLDEAASGTDAIFAMTTFDAGIDVEVRNGRSIAEAAKAAGVSHFVYSSVANADRKTGIPHFDSKWEVELHIGTLDFPWTVIGPVWFMDNLLFPWNVADLRGGSFRQALPPGRKLMQLPSGDIGRFAAHVIDRREPFIGKRIDIASDERTGPEMAEVLSAAIGRPIEYVEQSLEEVAAQFEDMAVMYSWFDQVGFSADIDRLRREYSEVGWTSLDQWAAKQDWTAVLATDD